MAGCIVVVRRRRAETRAAEAGWITLDVLAAQMNPHPTRRRAKATTNEKWPTIPRETSIEQNDADGQHDDSKKTADTSTADRRPPSLQKKFGELSDAEKELFLLKRECSIDSRICSGRNSPCFSFNYAPQERQTERQANRPASRRNWRPTARKRRQPAPMPIATSNKAARRHSTPPISTTRTSRSFARRRRSRRSTFDKKRSQWCSRRQLPTPNARGAKWRRQSSTTEKSARQVERRRRSQSEHPRMSPNSISVERRL